MADNLGGNVPNVTYLSWEDIDELTEIDPDTIVYVVNRGLGKPYYIRLSNLIQSLTVTDFDIDGGTFL